LHLVDRVLQRAAVCWPLSRFGGADRCLQMARDYALQRYVFGRPIGSFQAVKHRLADMYVRNELARSNAYCAAWALDTNAGELPIAAASARLAASDAFGFAAKENIHIHGGIDLPGRLTPSVFPACPPIEPGCRCACGLGRAIGSGALEPSSVVSGRVWDMNFNDSPQESIYRATVREWLANNAPRYTVSRRAPEVERLGLLARGRRAKRLPAMRASAGRAIGAAPAAPQFSR